MQKETISILGCGWLGMPLAKALIAQDYPVKGSTTNEDNLEAMRDAGIEPYLVWLDPEVNGEDITDFLQSDILIVNIPPERRDDIVEYHIEQFSSLIDALGQSPVRSVLFVSSTSVYPALQREVTEEDSVEPEALSGQALLHVEEMLMQETGFQTTVVRFGGLIGYDRNPEKNLARMTELKDPDQPMNLIHRDDCVRIIMEIIRLQQWGEVFNACCPVHPLKRDYYRRAAEVSGIPLPSLCSSEAPSPYKLVNSDKLQGALNYTFIYPDPVAQLG
ncbi:SDR family oxidoreductase [Chlorobium phaeobacteroides]|uniref:NAD-dependent epimerase/dehydratase n=1 Tax=Chlorobium phaeobacteroides (strain DSM 266 / SMG 266 / 2430) TaxID=290317 RepID=A1BD96_CHLPD|nr:SDR family oxidoreductase [Chlorobium phaeobacteroides]ABL64373.1 NAD-dependent epimerase/dehydratase [Chlorobium phaeobacteroides DSM 266]